VVPASNLAQLIARMEKASQALAFEEAARLGLLAR
jgi:excinuclease UvrABC nuclease subunit